MNEQTYETPVGNTVSGFENFHDGAKGGNPVTLEVTLDVASDVVEGLAPRPAADEEGNWPAQYVRRAKNAELFLARYIWDTDAGQASSETGVIGTSISYQSNPAVQNLAQSAMGAYAAIANQDEDGSSNKAYKGRL